MDMKTKRKLGFWENACKFGHDFFAGTSNVVARVNFTGDVDLTLVQQSLQRLYLRHPLLRAVITEKNHEAYFELKNDFSIIPVTILEKNHEYIWQAVVEQETIKKFPSTEYLWRAVLLYSPTTPHHELIVTFHHAIIDGLSSVNFMAEFFEFYTQAKTNDVNKTLSLLPHVESLLRQKNDWHSFAENKNKIQENSKTIWSFQQYAPIAQRSMRNIYRVLIPENLVQLKNICKRKKVTLNSLLNAAMLLAIQKQEAKTISCSLHTPVNLRSHTNPEISAEHLGCYISMVKTLHQQIHENMNLWQLAAAYQNQLQTNIPLIGFCPDNFSIADLDIAQITDLFDMPGSTKRNYFSQGFGITNIGVIDLATHYGAIKIDEFMFSTNHIMGDYIVFLHVLTFDDALYFCFSYAEPLVATSWAQSFVNHFMAILFEAIAAQLQLDAQENYSII